MGCSLLNGHISLLMHLSDDPSCRCGFAVESPKHYFLEYPDYAGPRDTLMTSVNNVTECNINVLLFGKKDLSLEQNKRIVQSVHNYMKATKRFEV